MGWDKGISFSALKKMIENEMRRCRQKATPRSLKRLMGLFVLWIQLMNGCRISEAVEALHIFHKTGERKVWVRVRKSSKNRKRLIIIPHNVKRGEVLYIPSTSAVKTLAQRLGINTHTLRYAMVTELARRGISVTVLSHITGHSNLSHLKTYTREKLALELLESFVEDLSTPRKKKRERGLTQ